MSKQTSQRGLYDAAFEHENCGIGAMIHIGGERTHQIVEDALTIVERLAHRAGQDAKGEVGDGVGILVQIPHAYYQQAAKELALPSSFGVGMLFFPQDVSVCKQEKSLFESCVKQAGLQILGWREVPVYKEVLKGKALSTMPRIEQVFLQADTHMSIGIALDRKLYEARRMFEHQEVKTYVCSMSSRTIVYKGMFLVHQLRKFYVDLQHPDFVSAIGLVHSRYSTNTFPSWERAHPNRLIVHNGEINTIRGNVDKMHAREPYLKNALFQNPEAVLPIIDPKGSDSARLDNVLEYLMMADVPLAKALMMCIPEPFEYDANMDKEKQALYQYLACKMEPWDGPASIVYSDGDVVGAMLDRNGLRPTRYYITKQNTLILSSEVGVLDIKEEDIVCKNRLYPGKMLFVDLQKGELLQDEQLKMQFAKKQPYETWLKKQLVRLKDIPNTICPPPVLKDIVHLQKYFGYSYDAVMSYLLPFAKNGIENVISMGTDSPLAVMSTQYHPLFDYFKQLFAQVTNPPIDAIREEIVTSSSVYLGTAGSILSEQEEDCHLLKITNPILSDQDMKKIKELAQQDFPVEVISLVYALDESLACAMEALRKNVDKAVQKGAVLLILSDRGVDARHLAIPSLLATGAVQQHLNQTKQRLKTSFIIESAEPFEVHHFATLLGYGAGAMYPYLAYATIQTLIEQGMLKKSYEQTCDAYATGALHGVVKIASKMGISTLQSYQGSQCFEAIGLAEDVVSTYFKNTIARIGGLTLQDIEAIQRMQHATAYAKGMVDTSLDSDGIHQQRMGKEKHLYNPYTIQLLQMATRENDYQTFKEFTKQITDELAPITLRGMWELASDERPSIPLEEVESVDSIVKRFKTGAMSYGSISNEAHTALAIAMNTLHGKSNTGEGGEEEERLHDAMRCSAIKQVASGRFGVTSSYLTHAVEIQIKMAQGAKPGEGGQLPAEKVYPWIAKTRCATTGVQLISPPPHHDIYSIEDLAQLIYDLKCANPQARISVKLVSEAGVGTVAAGVAKAGADVILISGHDGGTGAAPKNSVYHAGMPWELGLAEAQETLCMNDLRSQVVLETDGKLMSGKDIVIAALLGAEEFGFATTPLIALGCVMMRVCNLDTCPVGIATQNPILRKRFKGKPEYVMNFMRFIAMETREYMAELGFHSIEEMIGHKELIKVKKTALASKMDFSSILAKPYPTQGMQKKVEKAHVSTIDEDIWKQMKPYVEAGKPHRIQVTINNEHRSFGTLFGSYITRASICDVENDMYQIQAHGHGGQSFGAFLPQGIHIHLEGDSNDYVGKGLSGGRLSIAPSRKSTLPQAQSIIIGNVALYGATKGEAYICGCAGERFAVRNSGAMAVVEGVGDHALEYMTGGCVVILGTYGKNLAAGMSGGIAYILDEEQTLEKQLHLSSLVITPLQEEEDKEKLYRLLKNHAAYTGSKKANHILQSFDTMLPLFKKMIPMQYKRMQEEIIMQQKLGKSMEDAELAAFLQATQKKG